MRKILTLAAGDLKNITRDGMLLLSMLAPLILALVFRWGLPWATELIGRELHFDLTELYLFILSFVSLLIPLLLGTLVGFIILDDRDEKILTYLAVTPLSKTGYLFYRLLSPVVLSLICAVVGFWIIDLVPLNLGRTLPVFVLSALEAPMMGLFLGTFAANKVEGMALSKGLGVLFFAPIVGYFVRSPWQLIAGIFPPYWVSKAFVAAYQTGSLYWVYITVGLVIHLLVIYQLMLRFQKKAE